MPTRDELDVQTAVMLALPHATHPMHDNWRAKADVLIAGLRWYGYAIVPAAAEPGVAVPEPDEQQREVIACKHCDRIIPGDDCCMAGPAASPVAQEGDQR